MINSVIDVTRYKTFDTEAYVYEMEELYFDICKDCILQESTSVILTEASNGIFQRMVEWFKQLIDRFKKAIRELTTSITANSETLQSLSSKVGSDFRRGLINADFDVNGYEYTISGNIDINPLNAIYLKFNEMTKIPNEDRMIKSIEKLKTEWSSESHINKIRGEVIGVSRPVTANEFNDTIKKHFRNGQLDSKVIHIDNSYLNKIISKTDDIVREKKIALKEHDMINREVLSIQKYFEKIPNIIDTENGKALDIKRTWFDTDDWYRHVRESVVMEDEQNVYQKFSNGKASNKEEFEQFMKDKREADTKRLNDASREIAAKYREQSKADRKIIHDMDPLPPRRGRDDTGINVYRNYVIDIMKFMFTHSKTVSLIYTTVCAEKVKAINEQCTFYKAILKKASSLKKGDD